MSCSDETGEIDCIFFNSYEGYVKKILPLGQEITVSGKIGFFKNKYQLTNPKYVSEDASLIKQKHNTYSLTDGISDSEIRKKIKKVKKKSKKFSLETQNNIIKKLDFNLTSDQKKTLNEINNDLTSPNKMFRLLQGDVGSGKTIVSLLAAYNTVNSGFQVALMAPTEILAKQHYNFAKNLFSKDFNIELISGKSD